MQFSAYDRDNDEHASDAIHCAKDAGAGFWYYACGNYKPNNKVCGAGILNDCGCMSAKKKGDSNCTNMKSSCMKLKRSGGGDA